MVASRPNCGPPTTPPIEHPQVTQPTNLKSCRLSPQAGAAPGSRRRLLVVAGPGTRPPLG